MRTRRIWPAVGALLLVLLLGAPAAEAAFHVTGFSGSLTGGGAPLLQAGAHPDLILSPRFSIDERPPANEGEEPTYSADGNVRDVRVHLPAGFVGNPTVTSHCTQSELRGTGYIAECPPESQIGTAYIQLAVAPGNPVPEPLYNLVPPPGQAAQFGFQFSQVLTFIDTRVVPSSSAPGGYTLESDSPQVSQAIGVTGVDIELWGVPADPSHTPLRIKRGTFEGGVESNAPRLPFLANPTSCPASPGRFALEANGWLEPTFTGAAFEADPSGDPLIFGGCGSLPFEPTVQARPTTQEADAPSGLDVTVTVPQNSNPDGLASSELKSTVLTLPEGLTVNPAGAGGLESCPESQIGLGVEAPAACPERSKLGSVEIRTPLLDHPISGAVYLARQGENRFGSLLAIYLAIDDPLTGTVIKLPGKIATSASGRLTASFVETPQLPFETLTVKLAGGPRAPLRTPVACGRYDEQAEFEPWSGTPPVIARDSFQITSGPNGGACPNGGFAPRLAVSSANPLAGRHAPLGFEISRDDGTQTLAGLDLTLPTGLLGSLAGIPYCPDAALAGIPTAEGTGAGQLASPSCPAASQVGTVGVAAGAGPMPVGVETGRAYLAGPYAGAPLSLAVVTPALAGPFDLGNVVVRVALHVDPQSTQVTASSDPLPQVLDGIPLDLRRVVVSLDRPNFVVNPTNCAPSAVSAQIAGGGGAHARVAEPFQVAGCGDLAFAPKLSLALRGATRRAGDPALTAVLTYPKGQSANLARAQVVLPRSEFIDNAHIGTVCTRPQFAAESCPAGSLLGTASAQTPLLGGPLSGNVYLLANGGVRKLPDLVVALRGQIDVNLVGFLVGQKVKGSEGSRIKTAFASVPDAPISRFVLKLAGGKHGLLQNSVDLCRTTNRAAVAFTGQNGGRRSSSLPVAVKGCGARK